MLKGNLLPRVTGWSRHLCLRLGLDNTGLQPLRPPVPPAPPVNSRATELSTDAPFLCYPDRKPNDPERSRRGREVEWRDPDNLSCAHAVLGNSHHKSWTAGALACVTSSVSNPVIPTESAADPRESALVQTRRAEALSLPSRVASAQKKETPGEAPGVGVFALPCHFALAASGSDDFRIVGFEIRRISGSYQGPSFSRAVKALSRCDVALAPAGSELHIPPLAAQETGHPFVS